jgi:UDP-3-O-[3-hydroxymyristoyl] glucosamine N-acyltransferase
VRRGIALSEGVSLGALARKHGGQLRGGDDATMVARFVRIEDAREGDLAPLLASRFVRAAEDAIARGACVLVDASLASRVKATRGVWVHPFATWALAEVLDGAQSPETPAEVGEGSMLGEHVVLGPRVVVGARVRIGDGAVIGHPGFGWAFGDGARVRGIPQLGGVVIEDDVSIGPLSTIDAGTLGPTIVRRGAKLDAQCHVAHNCDIGEGTIVAAQSGFAGSVTIGRGVLVGGQVGIADHVTVGDGARIAAKSGVIGDVPPFAVVAGYPAVPRARWLRALARLYRESRS